MVAHRSHVKHVHFVFGYHGGVDSHLSEDPHERDAESLVVPVVSEGDGDLSTFLKGGDGGSLLVERRGLGVLAVGLTQFPDHGPGDGLADGVEGR